MYSLLCSKALLSNPSSATTYVKAYALKVLAAEAQQHCHDDAPPSPPSAAPATERGPGPVCENAVAAPVVAMPVVWSLDQLDQPAAEGGGIDYGEAAAWVPGVKASN